MFILGIDQNNLGQVTVEVRKVLVNQVSCTGNPLQLFDWRHTLMYSPSLYLVASLNNGQRMMR